LSTDVTIWGDPEASIHDSLRGDHIFNPSGGCLNDIQYQIPATDEVEPSGPTGELCPATLSRRPFLSNPTQCTTPVAIGLSIDSWEDPGNFLTYLGETQTLEACDQLEFEPTIGAKPTTDLGDSPSGLEVDLHIPQNADPDGLATAHLRDTRLTLPEGLVVNPSSANGLAACSPAEIGLTTPVGDARAHFSAAPAACPDASKLGTVEVDTPLIGHLLPGVVYLAAQGQNPFGSLLAIYITVEDPETGIIVKIPARLEADPASGRLLTVATESPQLPFEDLHLSLFKGTGAPLRTPVGCGTFSTTTDLTPWSSPQGADAFPADSFSIDHGAGGGPCVSSEAQAPAALSFRAGTVDPIAGAYSPFVLHLARADGTQQLTAIDTTLPPGLTGRLAGTTTCTEAALTAAASRSGREELAAPSCPASSRLGGIEVATGAGPTPYHADGNVYLAGPYRGAPISLAIITPALAGPFDLGNVIVRTALHVDPLTARIHAVSDPLPHILRGIPLDIRSIALSLDRPSFTRNPTSCDPMAIGGSAATLPGQSLTLASRFQVGDCAKLAFRPKLNLRLKGPVTRTANPRLIATLRAKPGEANISRAQVKLPRSALLDNSHIRGVCTRVQYAAGGGGGEGCPQNSVYGFAKATTPLLDKPLSGPVYLRSSSHTLPDLVASLDGQIHVDLVGKTDSVKGALRNTFEGVPDAPVSRFHLELFGGKRGLIEIGSGFCAHPRASVHLDAHSGKIDDTEPVVASTCSKSAPHHGRRSR
jgi:hypothetical protein